MPIKLITSFLRLNPSRLRIWRRTHWWRKPRKARLKMLRLRVQPKKSLRMRKKRKKKKRRPLSWKLKLRKSKILRLIRRALKLQLVMQAMHNRHSSNNSNNHSHNNNKQLKLHLLHQLKLHLLHLLLHQPLLQLCQLLSSQERLKLRKIPLSKLSKLLKLNSWRLSIPLVKCNPLLKNKQLRPWSSSFLKMFRDRPLEVQRQIPLLVRNPRQSWKQMLRLNRATKSSLKVRRLHLSPRKKSWSMKMK